MDSPLWFVLFHFFLTQMFSLVFRHHESVLGPPLCYRDWVRYKCPMSSKVRNTLNFLQPNANTDINNWLS